MAKLTKQARSGVGRKLSALLAAGIALSAATLPFAAAADIYRFIISGDPVAAATEDSCAVASTAASLVTGTLSTPTAAVPLEARYRTWDDSDGIALRSDRRATVIIFR